MTGKHGHPVRKSKQVCQAFVLSCGVAAAEVWTSDVADEQRITGQNHRRLGAAEGVRNQNRNQFRPVAGRMQDTEPQLPEFQLLAVAERLKRVGHLGDFVKTELTSVLANQSARAGDMVGMNVRINDILQPETALAQKCVVGLCVDRGIDDCRVVRSARGDQVRCTSTAFVQELLEIHYDDSRSLTGSWGLHRTLRRFDRERDRALGGYPIDYSDLVEQGLRRRRSRDVLSRRELEARLGTPGASLAPSKTETSSQTARSAHVLYTSMGRTEHTPQPGTGVMNVLLR